ncbi:MAG: DUF4232 domain-containing protein [Acidimicrobiales bacterium]
MTPDHFRGHAQRLVRVAVTALMMTAVSLVPVTNSLWHSSPPASAASLDVCSAQDLEVMVAFNGPGNRFGAITFDNVSSTPCELSGRPTVRVVTKDGRDLPLHETTERLSPPLAGPTSPVVLSAKAPWAVVEMEWCGFQSTYNHIDVLFRGWKRPLLEKNPPYSTRSFMPPPCSHPASSLMAVDYVRSIPDGTISGTTPTVTVRPSTDLHNGERVTVSVNGFGLGAKFWLSECFSKADVGAQGCGQQLAAQPFGLTGMQGSGSYEFTVSTRAATAPYDPASVVSCLNHCVLMATSASPTFASAPLSFGP